MNATFFGRQTPTTRPALSRCLFAVLASLFLNANLVLPALSQSEGIVGIGAFVQKNAVSQPGIRITYSGAARLPRQLRFSFAYTSSRPAVAFGSRGLVEDRLLIGAAWMLRPRRAVKPFGEIGVGYTRFSREDEEIFALLDNDAFIATALIGLDIQIRDTPVAIQADAGYSILQSSTVYPFVTSIGVYYRL